MYKHSSKHRRVLAFFIPPHILIYSCAKDIYFFGTIFGLWQCSRVVNMSMSEHKWKKCSKNMFYNTFEMRYVATGVKNN